MHYLVDAYNFLFRTLKKRSSLEKSRRQMIEELNDAVSLLNMHVTLVFDGAEEHLPHASRGHYDAIELVYTPKSKTADDYIAEVVSHSKLPSEITVVTNDRELASFCRNHRAKIQTIDAFIAFLSKKKSKRKKMPARPFKTSSSEFTRLLLIFEKRMWEEINKEMEDL